MIVSPKYNSLVVQNHLIHSVFSCFFSNCPALIFLQYERACFLFFLCWRWKENSYMFFLKNYFSIGWNKNSSGFHFENLIFFFLPEGGNRTNWGWLRPTMFDGNGVCVRNKYGPILMFWVKHNRAGFATSGFLKKIEYVANRNPSLFLTESVGVGQRSTKTQSDLVFFAPNAFFQIGYKILTTQ